MEIWEQVLLGAAAILLVFLFFPGVKAMLEKSKNAPKDWKGLIIPVALVVVFVLFLISTL